MPHLFRPASGRAGTIARAVALTGCVAGWSVAAGGGESAAEVRRLVGEFRQAADTAAREAVATELLAAGDDGAEALLTAARSELVRLEKPYAGRCQRVAADVLAERRRGGPPAAEIAELRKTILDVAALDPLTKETIAARSDPALTRLENLLSVSPADVVARDARLAADRELLLLLADLATRAADRLPEAARRKLTAVPIPTTTSIAVAETTACLLARSLTAGDRQAVLANAIVARQLEPEEAAGIARLQEIRTLVGLPAQAVDPKLVAACRTHSRDMQERGFFAHESPVAGRETPWKRAEAAGTTASAENIFSGSDSGRDAIDGWWHSPGHHKNLLGDHRRTGLGCWRGFWTQLFD